MKLRKIFAPILLILPILFALFFAVVAQAAVVTPVASGLNAAIGQAYSASENAIILSNGVRASCRSSIWRQVP